MPNIVEIYDVFHRISDVSKTSVMSFHFKNIGLTINHTESKMFDRKNLTCGNRGTGRKSSQEKN